MRELEKRERIFLKNFAIESYRHRKLFVDETFFQICQFFLFPERVFFLSQRENLIPQNS
jgi:hypothetical protein